MRIACLPLSSFWPRTLAPTRPFRPFIFFQLAPWPNLESGAIARQRAAQVNATNLPKVGMVVAADRGDAAGAFHPIHPPVKEELSHRAFLVTDNLVYGNSSSPVQGPQPIRATFEPWDASWADFHYGTGAGSYVCHAGSGFSCGGIKVEFDQDLVLASTYVNVLRSSLHTSCGALLLLSNRHPTERARVGSSVPLSSPIPTGADCVCGVGVRVFAWSAQD